MIGYEADEMIVYLPRVVTRMLDEWRWRDAVDIMNREARARMWGK